MAVQPEGTPCWVDAMFSDVEGAKSFYGDVLGWTFGESSSEYGNYTQAYADGKAVAAVVPPMPAATAEKIRRLGGEVLMEPMQVGEFGTMCLGREPSGAVFGVWQAGTHEGFEAPMEQPGAFCWAEVFTREPEKADTFLAALFPYTMKQMQDDAVDFRLFELGDRTALGRMTMTEEFPPEIPSYINVYFTVADCDEAVAAATKLGAQLRFGPMDTPFGRFASLTDPQGANFSVIDVTTTAGEMPQTTEVS